MAKDKDEIKESIFKIAQTFLKNHKKYLLFSKYNKKISKFANSPKFKKY